MGFNLNNVPEGKPSSFADITLADGIHPVTVEKVEYTTSTNGNKMLKLRYKTIKEGKFVFDQIMDDPTKQVNLYRLGKLLTAINVTLAGEVELKDMTKIIKIGAKLRVAIVTKESGYCNIDIDKYEGYYPFEVAEGNSPAPTAVEETVEQAPTLDIATADDDEFF